MDHLLAINQLIEKSNEYQLDLCIGFIDYEKAFDSIEHPDLFQALREIGIMKGMFAFWKTFTQMQHLVSIWTVMFLKS